MKYQGLIAAGVSFIISCSPAYVERDYYNSNCYAERFQIQDMDSFHYVSLFNPWQGGEGRSLHYVFAQPEVLLPDSLEECKRINTPVSTVAVFSTTHVGFISALGEITSIWGISGLQYVCDSTIKEGERQKKVREIGIPPDINYDALLEIKPDIVFLYGLDPGIISIASRMEKSGIPVILIGEYLESHPLGKMEWIKIFGALYNKQHLTDSIFNSAKEQYEKLSGMAVSSKYKPAVLTGLPWKDTWYMAGGQSFTAKLIKDAGAVYLWENDRSTEFIPLSLESVLIHAMKADYWINTGTANGLDEIVARDPRFGNVPALNNNSVFNNNALVCPSGGNQFWERGVVEPHIILEDLIKIFHPGMLNSDSLVYYRKMK